MTAAWLIQAVLAVGGVLELEGDRISYDLPRAAGYFVEYLREFKPEVVAMLERVGGRIAYLPACPQCLSFALYRENNADDFECLTCGLKGIEENLARVTAFQVESKLSGRVV